MINSNHEALISQDFFVAVLYRGKNNEEPASGKITKPTVNSKSFTFLNSYVSLTIIGNFRLSMCISCSLVLAHKFFVFCFF